MRVPYRKEQVLAALFKSWSLATSSGWLADNPARGQCNVTALLLSEQFGGEILKTPLPEGDHFYNRIDGERIDLTESQFAQPITYLDIASDKDEALAGTTAEKFATLRTAFLRNFGANWLSNSLSTLTRTSVGPGRLLRHCERSEAIQRARQRAKEND